MDPGTVLGMLMNHSLQTLQESAPRSSSHTHIPTPGWIGAPTLDRVPLAAAKLWESSLSLFLLLCRKPKVHIEVLRVPP